MTPESRVAAAMPRRPLPAGHPLRGRGPSPRRTGGRRPRQLFPPAADDLAVHRLLRAIARNTCLSRLRLRPIAPPDAWLAPPDGVPPALRDAARRPSMPPPRSPTRLTFTGPHFGTVLPPLAGARMGDCRGRRLRAEAYAGAHRRYGGELAEAVVERLEHELTIIAAKGFAAYFLVVRDIVRVEPAHLRPRLGRGLARRLLPRHHQRLPAQAQPLLRALPQPGPHGPARHRRRLRLGRARRRAGLRARAPPRPRRHGGQPRPLPAAHGGARSRQGLRPDRGRDRPRLRAPALVLARRRGRCRLAGRAETAARD